MFFKNKFHFFLFQTLMLFLIISYSLFGMLLFYAIEKRPHDNVCYDAKREADASRLELRNQLISYIKGNASTSNNLTEVVFYLNDLLDGYTQTALAQYLGGYAGSDCVQYSAWTLANVFLFAVRRFTCENVTLLFS